MRFLKINLLSNDIGNQQTILFFIICLLIFSITSCQTSSASLQNKSDSTITKNAANQYSDQIKLREQFVERIKPRMEMLGVNINISGKDKDVLNLESNDLEATDIASLFTNLLNDYRSAGFTEILIKGKDGKTQSIKLNK